MSNDLCPSVNFLTKSSFIIFSRLEPETTNPITKQVIVTVSIEIKGHKRCDSFNVKKNDATASPTSPTIAKSPRRAPNTHPFAPLPKYPIPYMILAITFKNPIPDEIIGKEAPPIKIATMNVGNCSKKLL